MGFRYYTLGDVSLEKLCAVSRVMPLDRVWAKLIIFGLLQGSFAIALNTLYLVMIGKINQRVRENQRISFVLWGSGVKKQLRQLYPDRKLLIAIRIGEICFFLAFLVLVGGIMGIMHSPV